MKNILIAVISVIAGFAIIAFGYSFYSDTNSSGIDSIAEKTDNTAANNPLESIQGSFDLWDTYSKNNIDLMSSFHPLDENGKTIGKGMFLSLLRTGLFLPNSGLKNGKKSYRLVSLKKNADEKVKKNIISLANTANHYFRLEGKKLPDYNFVSLKGQAFNKKDTKGKLVVIKCWFITCKICVEEFPELNKLVDKYKDKNVVFVSLAFDKKDKLEEFLKTKEFKYPTVPSQKEYMVKKLKLKQYPTHIIVDSNGVIMKMVSNVHTLASELDRIKGKF
ncbi:Thiol-disulfide isomerase or thioredoxin [Tenacibaculum sp. MAR_2009_124]|uniref:TlpA family protein disulfide reductase n=1 Tax=Tenacibaculum sp. MAR_2009_124 TaxID=1250059 RepID=UPI000897FCA9|nr:TlpA disulfide reductase family protein [Tenacibaculum sp. MAR_2009_124]SED08301.1 Thiol-disulfide isomerase or thioredoxin [Tenacibaculum sp. MAR_2009_124]